MRSNVTPLWIVARKPKYPLTVETKLLLSRAREKKDLSRRYVAGRMHVSEQALRALELDRDAGGTRATWSTDRLPEWCRALGVDLIDAMPYLDEDQRELLRLLEAVRSRAPDSTHAFLDAVRAMASGFQQTAPPPTAPSSNGNGGDEDEDDLRSRRPRGH